MSSFPELRFVLRGDDFNGFDKIDVELLFMVIFGQKVNRIREDVNLPVC